MSVCRLNADFRRFGLRVGNDKGNGIPNDLRCILRGSRRLKNKTRITPTQNGVKRCGKRVCGECAQTVYQALKIAQHRQGQRGFATDTNVGYRYQLHKKPHNGAGLQAFCN